ncbi:MAG: ferredoxin [Candidatus Omnitrophota bacterium]|nr:ferredoxin [Candidatus Omnitrophota bacterium]
MTKITVDEELCTGCGLCASSCPEIFEMKDDNKAHVIASESKSCDLNQVASECPLNAIKVD